MSSVLHILYTHNALRLLDHFRDHRDFLRVAGVDRLLRTLARKFFSELKYRKLRCLIDCEESAAVPSRLRLSKAKFLRLAIDVEFHLSSKEVKAAMDCLVRSPLSNLFVQNRVPDRFIKIRGIDAEGLRLVFQALTFLNTKLTELTLIDVDLDAEMQETLGEFVPNHPEMQWLNISLTTTGSIENIDVLLSDLKQCEHLRLSIEDLHSREAVKLLQLGIDTVCVNLEAAYQKIDESANEIGCIQIVERLLEHDVEVGRFRSFSFTLVSRASFEVFLNYLEKHQRNIRVIEPYYMPLEKNFTRRLRRFRFYTSIHLQVGGRVNVGIGKASIPSIVPWTDWHPLTIRISPVRRS